MNEWMNVPLNIAFTGDSGAGKSSLINSFRDLTDDDYAQGAAKVGINETTMEPTPYTHPANAMMKLWDLPGVGTPSWPRETYAEKVGLKDFDYFIIVCARRFSAEDIWLAKEIKAHNKEFLFVRSQAGVDRDNLKKSNPSTYKLKQASLVADIRGDIKKNLGDLYVAENVMVIDSYEKLEFEYGTFQERLIETFPEEKRMAVLRSISVMSTRLVKAKVAHLRTNVKYTAALSAAGGLIPVPGPSAMFDVALMVKQAVTYYRELGLDDESLKKLARMSGISSGALETLVRQNLKAEMLTVQVPGAAAMTAGEEVMKSWTIAIPILSSVVGAAMSFGVTSYVLHELLTALEPVAIAVLDLAMKERSQAHMD